MAVEQATPFKCHIFICTHDRKGKDRSCADQGGKGIRDQLKQKVSDRGWKKKVRVSQSGCLGPCEHGPNVMIYPQQIWFSNVSAGDIGQIIARVEMILGDRG